MAETTSWSQRALRLCLAFVLALALMPSAAFATAADEAQGTAKTTQQEASQADSAAQQTSSSAAAEADQVATAANSKSSANTQDSEAVEALDPTDISGFTLAGVEDSYQYTTLPISITPTVTDGSGSALTKGTDYTVTYTDVSGDTVAAPTEVGSYTITITGTGVYAGTITKDFAITDSVIFTVYKQAGTNEKVELKQYTATDLETIASDSTDPVSGMFYKSGAWHVVTSTHYILIDDLFADVGLDGKWTNGTSIAYADTPTSGGTVSYEDMIAQPNFYPNTEADQANTEGATQVPGVLTLTEYSGAIGDGGTTTAAELEQYNADNQNIKNKVRMLYGVSEDNYLADNKPAGKRYWSRIQEVTLKYAATDISDYTLSGIEDNYDYTGSAVALDPAVADGSGSTLTKDTDYTVTYTDASNNPVAAPTEVGTYTATITGIGDYKGTITKSFTITEPIVFRVYKQAGDNDRVLVKACTADQLEELASDSSDPVSGMFYKGGWRVTTSTHYVVIDDLFEGLGLGEKWTSGSTLAYADTPSSGGTATYDALHSQTNFYPNTQYNQTDTEGVTQVPAILALTEYSGIIGDGDSTDAAGLQQYNVTKQNTNNKMRIIYGVSEDNYLSDSSKPAGKRYWSRINDVTLKYAQVDLSGFSLSGVDDAYIYSGNPVSVAPVVRAEATSEPLVENTDYTVTYQRQGVDNEWADTTDLTSTGTLRAVITGTGDYTGSITKQFEIRDAAAWDRLAGQDRYGTMKAIVDEAYPEGSTSEYAVLVRGDSFPDAISASALAGTLDCPIITTDTTALSDQAKGELERLGVKKVYIMGTSQSVSGSIEDTVQGLGIWTQRVAGSSRVETSVAAAEVAKASGSTSDTCIITKGWAYADALAISSYAYASGSPVFLGNEDNTISDAVAAAISEGGYTKVIVLGDNLATDAASLAKLPAGAQVQRLAGSDRYATADAIVQWTTGAMTSAAFQPAAGTVLSYDGMGVAMGDSYPDALVSSCLLGRTKSVLMTVPSTATAADTATQGRIESVVGSHKIDINQGYIFGSTRSVPQIVEDWLNEASK